MRADEIAALLEFFYFLAILALFILVPWRSRRARAAVARGDGLARIAPALGGEVARDPSFDGPFIRFKTKESPTYCHQWLLFPGRTQIVTTFECRVGFRAFLEATSERSKRYPSRSPRFREIPPDHCFRIVTTDAPWAKEILDCGLRQILEDFGGWCPARIQLAIDRFLVEVESPLSPSQAVFMTQTVARVAALGRATSAGVGVTFLEGVELGTQGRCPVCGQAFELAGVHCAQCRIPHHPDCWAYWGRCAIFGCRGQRVTLATSASR
jgi:hypothetical protein